MEEKDFDKLLSKTVKKPRLYVTFDMETNRDSYGRITVTKK